MEDTIFCLTPLHDADDHPGLITQMMNSFYVSSLTNTAVTGAAASGLLRPRIPAGICTPWDEPRDKGARRHFEGCNHDSQRSNTPQLPTSIARRAEASLAGSDSGTACAVKNTPRPWASRWEGAKHSQTAPHPLPRTSSLPTPLLPVPSTLLSPFNPIPLPLFPTNSPLPEAWSYFTTTANSSRAERSVGSGQQSPHPLRQAS